MTNADKTRIILSISSCLGVAGTMVLTHFNTIKAQEILKQNHPNDEVSKQQEMKETWKYYIPATICGMATITAIVVNHRVGAKEIAALIASGGMSFATLTKYKQKVREIVGNDTFVEIERAMAKDAELGIQHAKPAIWTEGLCTTFDDPTEDGKLLFYDSMSDTWFRAALSTVYNARYHLNRNFQLRGNTTVAEWRSFLGLEDKKGYDTVGWGFSYIEGGCYTIDIDVIAPDAHNSIQVSPSGEPYYIIAPVFGAEELTEEDGY